MVFFYWRVNIYLRVVSIFLRASIYIYLRVVYIYWSVNIYLSQCGIHLLKGVYLFIFIRVVSIYWRVYIYVLRLKINSCFVTFVPASGGQILPIYYTLYGLCQKKHKMGGDMRKKLMFGFTPPMSLETYCYFYLCICVDHFPTLKTKNFT